LRAIFLIFLASTFSSIASDTLLTVLLERPIIYINDKGELFSATYGQLSDKSLNFVKVSLPDGRKLTLPQVISGSGARYTDDRTLVWWEHKGTVTIDIRDSEGKWETKYKDLIPVAKTKENLTTSD
jgi:membrane-bound inhibitor of C-type lysozyme